MDNSTSSLLGAYFKITSDGVFEPTIIHNTTGQPLLTQTPRRNGTEWSLSFAPFRSSHYHMYSLMYDQYFDTGLIRDTTTMLLFAAATADHVTARVTVMACDAQSRKLKTTDDRGVVTFPQTAGRDNCLIVYAIGRPAPQYSVYVLDEGLTNGRRVNNEYYHTWSRMLTSSHHYIPILNAGERRKYVIKGIGHGGSFTKTIIFVGKTF